MKSGPAGYCSGYVPAFSIASALLNTGTPDVRPRADVEAVVPLPREGGERAVLAHRLQRRR